MRARGAYKGDGRDGRDGRGGRDNQPNGECDASGRECGKRRDGDDSQANAPEMAQRRRKRGRDFARQGRRRLSDGPARQASEEEATLVAPRAQEAQDNVIESDDDVDVNDVNDDDLPAELGECSMGNDGFDSPPGLQLTGHTSRAGGDEETLVELSLKIKKRLVETNSPTLPFSCWERTPGLNERRHRELSRVVQQGVASRPPRHLTGRASSERFTN